MRCKLIWKGAGAKPALFALVAGFSITVLGCGGDDTATTTGGTPGAAGTASGAGGASAEKPVFSLAWSEYPSWSVFGVADEKKLIDKDEGEFGPIEEKWGVDIVLNEADYDGCLTQYANANCDAVCITNMDILASAAAIPSVAILPTSTSAGADALIAVGVEDAAGLKGKKIYGLQKSVSEYVYARCMEEAGLSETDAEFTNMDPGAAASAMQTNAEGIEAIMVWNPFVLQTLHSREGAKVIFDSTQTPGEIIDMVVIRKAVLQMPGGEDFACAVIDTYYALNTLLNDADQGNETLVALGAKFSNLGLQDMKTVIQQTQFYGSPEEGIEVYSSELLPNTMKTVTDFCVSHQIIDSAPKIAYGTLADQPDAQLLFDTEFMQRVKEKSP